MGDDVKPAAVKPTVETPVVVTPVEGQEPGPGAPGTQPPVGPPPTWDEVFKHPRFAQLNQRAKEAEKKLTDLEQAAEDAKQTQLVEQQKFKELYEAESAKRTALEGQLTQLQAQQVAMAKRRAIEETARAFKPAFTAKAVEDAHLFVDLAALTLDEAGHVQGVEAAIKQLAEERPYMLEVRRADGGSPPARPARQLTDEDRRAKAYQARL